MALKRKEYLLAINTLNKPVVATENDAVAVLLMRLILLEPNSDPLHPGMGVGIVNYRFALNKLDELRERINDQINTYLPQFNTAKVELKELKSDKLCNIEITVDDVVYIYDSRTAPIPISLTTIGNN